MLRVRPALQACFATCVAAIALLVPSAASAGVSFINAGNMKVVVVFESDGELVGGVPANHKWQLIQEGGPNDPTATSIGLRAIDPTGTENYNGVMPTGANSQYGNCTRDSDQAINCFAAIGYVFSEIVVNSGAGNDFVDASRVSMPVQLFGANGGDLLFGGRGNDYIAGGDGDDTIDGNCGRDTMLGTTGFDTISYDDRRAYQPCASRIAVDIGVTVNINDVADDPDQENFRGADDGFEAIVGTDASDVIILGAGAMTVTAKGGDDVIEARNGVKDTLDCGAANDRATVDASTVDTVTTGCETVEYLTPNLPTPPTTTVQGNCKAGQTSVVVNGVRLCADSQKAGTTGTAELSGNISIEGFLTIDMKTPLVVDANRRSASYAGPATIYASNGRFPQSLLSNSVQGKFAIAPSFSITSDATPAAYVGNVSMRSYDPATGIVADGFVKGMKLQVSTSATSATYLAGAKFIGGALTATGTIGYSKRSGVISSVRGCLDAALPLGGASRFTELRNTCLAYSAAYDTWELKATASLAGLLSASATARTVAGPDIDEYVMNIDGVNAPIGLNTMVGHGYIRARNLKTPSSTSIDGGITARWTAVPTSPGLANLEMQGDVGYDNYRRELSFRGDGTLSINGQAMTSGTVNLRVNGGTAEVPAGMKLSASVLALSGFITGDVNASINGTSFYAAGKMTMGFPSGAPITNQVNGTIEDVLFCDWGPANWCPYVTGLTTSTEAALSHKGIGARANISVLYGTFWWIGKTKSFNVDLGIGGSKSLADALQRKAGATGSAFRPKALAAVRPEFGAAAGATSTWTIPASAKLASLQLGGSTSGQLRVVDPSGRVVFDSAAGVQVEGVGFGRDPSATGRASFGLFAPAIKPGVWTVSTASAQPFTSIESLMSLPPTPGAVTSARIIGADAKARGLVAGTTKVRIAYRVAAGTQLSVRAETPDGSLSIPVAATRTRSGVVTWTVSKRWAGKLRFVAVTERDTVPVGRTTFGVTFDVERPAIAAPKKISAKRGRKGTVIAAWTPVAGATSYEVSTCIGLARVASRVITTKPRLTLTPRSTLGLRLRVRALSSFNTSGRWSREAKVAATRTTKPKVGKQPSCSL